MPPREAAKKLSEPVELEKRGRAFASVGDFTRAEQYFTLALEAGGDDRRLTAQLLSVCVKDRKYDAALKYVEDCLGRHPDDAHLRLVAATLSSAIGRADAASEHYESALSDLPDDAGAHLAYARLLRDELDDRVGADRHFREYLRLDPRGVDVREAERSLLKEVR